MRLAASLGVKPGTIRDWGRCGLIPRVKISHKIVRYDPKDVVAAMKKRAAERSQQRASTEVEGIKFDHEEIIDVQKK